VVWCGRYDRSSQLDRALLVVGLLVLNTGCWLLLALAEPDAPATAWLRSAAVDSGLLPLLQHVLGGPEAAHATSPAVEPLLRLSGPTKVAISSIAGATIALPSSLPFAIFALDFGKEGAAVLSALISVVGSLSALAFLKSFPAILRARGWFGVHALLASLSLVAALAMAAIMFSDSRKFARGYVVRSSLLNETVVTLHACSNPACASAPMWRPGQRRTWGLSAGRTLSLRPHAPSNVCHNCGRSDMLLECSVDEAAAAAALLTPFEACGEWVREEKLLRRPRQGWAYTQDPTAFPLAAADPWTGSMD
jgi:hypothetical protein